LAGNIVKVMPNYQYNYCPFQLVNERLHRLCQRNQTEGKTERNGSITVMAVKYRACLCRLLKDYSLW